MRKCTRATPAGVPRSRSRWTRRQRAEIRQNFRDVQAECDAWEELYGEEPMFRDVDDEYCDTCSCRGFVTYCPDDLCQGDGGCIHGDNQVCPECGGRWLL